MKHWRIFKEMENAVSFSVLASVFGSNVLGGWGLEKWSFEPVIDVIVAIDPNDKVGPGAGEAGHVRSDAVLPYTIHFENLPAATAPALEVVVTDTLDPNLDWTTFELGEMGFGNMLIEPPPAIQEYSHALETTNPDGSPLWVRVQAGLDLDNGVVTWTFTSIDPATGQSPEDPEAGFLPPNDDSHRGEGFVSFFVRPKANLDTGVEIRNRARIVFDTNDPIDTNEVLNTIDAGTPASRVAELPPLVYGETVRVSWSGEDEPGGAGVALYDVYYSEDGGPYQPWKQATPDTSADFTGQSRRRYSFYSVAIDAVGHREPSPKPAETETLFEFTNDPPGAFPQTVIADQDTARQITLGGEDGDPEVAQVLTYAVAGGPEHGVLTDLDPLTGEVTYTPDPGYFGPDHFTFTVTDDALAGPPAGLVSPPATVTLWVNPVVPLPAGRKDTAFLLKRNGNNVQLVNNRTKKPVFNASADLVYRITVLGAADKGETLTIDPTAVVAGSSLQGGVVFDGRSGKKADTLVLRGTPGSDTFSSDLGSAAIGPLVVQFAGVEQLRLDGGAGNDTYRISALSTKTTLADSKGTDLLDFSQATEGVGIDLGKNRAQRQEIFASNSATLALKGTLENVIGTPQADWIKGNAAANRIEGRGGSDTLFGGAGNDTLYGGDGDDWLYGDAGHDNLYGESGNNMLLGGAGNDNLDVLMNADAADRNLLIGGLGADTLTGGPGEEILIGGTTRYDNKLIALAAVMLEWVSDKTYDARCANLDAGFDHLLAGFVQLKRKTKANPQGTVIDDGVRDKLFGGDGNDWLFDFARDEAG